MKTKNFFQQLTFHFINMLVLLNLIACNQEAAVGKRSSLNKPFSITGGNSGSGSNGAPGDNTIGGGSTSTAKPKVEIRHFVNPRSGSFVQKLTIPKNFSGYLYLSGLNITSLADRHITVNFYFGHTREPVSVTGVVARAPGITPTTDIEVLILNMNSKPFEQIRLLYDLYDYNEYDFDAREEDGSFTSEETSDEPVTSNLDEKLYCRALLLDDDPTYRGSTGQCKSKTDTCLYGYAKVKDRGLQKMDENFEGGLPLYPVYPNVDHLAMGLFNDESSVLFNRCLPDNVHYDESGTYDPAGAFFKISESLYIDSLGGSVTNSEEVEHIFLGPYQTVNKSLWQITENATIGDKGVFKDTLDSSGEVAPEDFGNISLMFPRYVKKQLNANIEHLSSERPNGYKEVNTLASAGQTNWMDGCNERVSSLNYTTNEHIGSCSVSAIIEIVAKDPTTGDEEIVAGRADGGVEVKLQLVKASATNNIGQEVLMGNLNNCANSNNCGVDECCYNNKCWSKSIVSSCKEDQPVIGNYPIGQTCTTDYQCSSLCCNKSTGRCAVHDTNQEPPVLCSKPAGQQCISKEFCAQSVIQECLIVKTGVDNTGATTCALRCYNRLKHGDCTNGLCVPPVQPSVPIFNPADPNRCDQAVDPPSE